MSLGVVLVAAGTGQRLGSPGPKALVELVGRPLLVYALERLEDAGLPPPVVVHPPDAADAFREAIGSHPIATLVPGGATRAESVRAGVAAIPDDADRVVVHDAARPLVPATVVRATLRVVRDDVCAAAPGLEVADTLKRAVDGHVAATVDREGLVAIQTPQVFRRAVLELALSRGATATDELALVERLLADGSLDGRIAVTTGSPLAMKVTFPQDLVVLAALVSAGEEVEV